MLMIVVYYRRMRPHLNAVIDATSAVDTAAIREEEERGGGRREEA